MNEMVASKVFCLVFLAAFWSLAAVADNAWTAKEPHAKLVESAR